MCSPGEENSEIHLLKVVVLLILSTKYHFFCVQWTLSMYLTNLSSLRSPQPQHHIIIVIGSYFFRHRCPRPRARSISSLSQVAGKTKTPHYPYHHCHKLRASAPPTPVTTWWHSHLRAFKNTIFAVCRALNSQLYFTTPPAQTHYNSSQRESYIWEFCKLLPAKPIFHRKCEYKLIHLCVQIYPKV